MKKTLYGLVAILIVFLITSCGNETKDISITLVLDKPVADAKYPSGFNVIATPFTSDCQFDFLPKPINILRLDISNQEKKTNAWHFENIGENTVDFSKTWLEFYFKDSTENYLIAESKKIADVERFMKKNKDNVYIYCENCEVEEYGGIPIYTKSEEIADAIKFRACKEELKNVYIYYNPAILYNVVDTLPSSGIPKPDSPKSEEPEKPKNNSASYVPPSTPSSSNCIDQIKPSTNELSELMALIANKSIDACRKTKLKSYLSNYFTSDAEIVTVTNNCGENITYNVSQLYSVLLNSGKSLFIQSQCKEETEMVGNKYRKVPVQIVR